jgi:hypothetical protein
MKRYKDVSFGSNSPTALFRRGQKSIILVWSLLVFTSLPIHLFLNGVTGYSIQVYPFTGHVVLMPNNTDGNSTFPIEANWIPGRIQRTDCARFLVEAENWVTEFENLTIVLNSLTDGGSNQTLKKYKDFVNDWDTGVRESEGPPTADEIDHCYMNARVPECAITVRWFPLAATTIALSIKMLTAILAILKTHHFNHRLYNSLGDIIAVATRHREDLAVPGECLVDKGEHKKREDRAWNGEGSIPIRAQNRRRRWIRYLGFLDWTVWVFWVGSVVAVWILMDMSLDTVRSEFRNDDGSEITSIFGLFSIAGFGKISLAFLLSSSQGNTSFHAEEPIGLPIQIAIANAPQLWLSLGYLLWDNQITRIWGEHEWRSYAGRRKVPRVSYGADSPGVRNTRWLQLPYWLSATLMSISTLMHWVVSQTLFVVEVENRSGISTSDTPSQPQLTFAICYSPTAIFTIAVIAMILIIALTVYYLIPFRSWMPVMGGSARVVFASCTALPKHLPADGIMWGDVSDDWGRLAGFGENANALKAGDIYPERSKRLAATHPPRDQSSDRPITARTVTLTPVVTPALEQPSSLSHRSINVNEPEGHPAITPPATSKTTAVKYARVSTAEPAPNIFRPETSSSLQYPFPVTPRPPSVSSRASQPPQTKRPRGNIQGLGTGYNTEEFEFKRQFKNLISDGPGELRYPEDDILTKSPNVKDDDSDVEPAWQGWGFKAADDHASESENEMAETTEPEWRGWGHDTTRDERRHSDDKTALVGSEWRGWGV